VTEAHDRGNDRGAVLPLVLVFVLVLGFVLAGIARYTATNLRYSVVVEERSAAASAAEAGLRYAIQRVDANAVTTCDGGPVAIVPTYDVSMAPVLAEADSLTISCSRLDSGDATLAGWTAVVTGEGVTGTTCGTSATSVTTGCRFLVQKRSVASERAATGRIYLPSLRQTDFRINVEDVEFAGNLFYDGSGDGCATIEQYDESSSTWDDDIVLTSGQFVCWPQTWDDVVEPPPIDPNIPTPADTPLPPAGTDVVFWGSSDPCRIFEPGRYTSLDLQLGGANYFKSGAYRFDGVSIDTGPTSSDTDTLILGGYPRNERFENRLITASACSAAQADDGTVSADLGVTWYLENGSELRIRRGATVELLPMLQTDVVGREHAVSIHVLDAGPSTGDAIGIDSAGLRNDALFQGQIWAPYGRVDLRSIDGDADGQVTSGVVAAQLLVDSTSVDDTGVDGSGALRPSLTSADYELVLSSTATVDGITVEARAVVEHRPGAAVGDRVAARSIRIID